MKPTALAILLLVACGPAKSDTDTDADTTNADTLEATTTEPTTGEPLGNPAGPCNPQQGDDECPATYVCCSDDPATVGGKLPNYFEPGKNDAVFGTPIFSAANNDLGVSGQCVDPGELASPFKNDCAVPCNPRWDAPSLAEICGATSVCCPFTLVDPNKDCVNDDGTWRAVTGADIGEEFGNILEVWGPLHTTNQDPNGTGCMDFATVDGVFSQAAFDDCIDQLSVADQRGLCYAAAACPCTEDLCAQKNPGYVARCP